MPQLNDLYLYLARRDKSGIRILAKFQGDQQLPVRVEDVELLSLPTGWAGQLTQIIYDSRMLWEPWVQSAKSYEELRAALKTRGYKAIPVSSRCEFTTANTQTPLVNVANLPKKTTMLRRNP